MTLARVERYVIERGARGIALRMRQGRRALGVGLLSLAVLSVSWWFGPYGPQPAANWGRSDAFYWVWSGFFSLVALLALIGAWYQEDWTITDQEIVVTKCLGPWCRTRRVPRAHALGIRVEILTDVDEGAMFPYRLHFLDAARKDSGLLMELQLAGSVERVLEALRATLTLDVEQPSDLRQRRMGS